MTLQLNKEQVVVKDNRRADVWKVTFFFCSPLLFQMIKHMLETRLVAFAKSAPPRCVCDPTLTVEVFSGSLGLCHLNFLFPLTSLSQRRLRSRCRVSNPGQQGA